MNTAYRTIKRDLLFDGENNRIVNQMQMYSSLIFSPLWMKAARLDEQS